MIEGFATGIALLALALGAVALLFAALDRLVPRLHLLGLFLLQGILLVQGGLALARMGSWGGSNGELLGYLAVSLLLVPGGLVLAVEERSRWGTLVLSAACLTVAVVQVRLLTIWHAGLGVGGG
ncbi:MAG: hypothetical protein WD794_10640 [Mycobacteriales bacterium]